MQKASRFIPARGGNSSRSRPLAAVPPVHPRVRGKDRIALPLRGAQTDHPHVCREHRAGEEMGAPLVGSSLPMRGEFRFSQKILHSAHSASGSSPRVRGKQCALGSLRASESGFAVHPRARGKQWNAIRSYHRRSVYGSSPRAGETEATLLFFECFGRFIPTRGGNRSARCRWNHSRTVHPHARGKQPDELAAFEAEDGSSPGAGKPCSRRNGYE